MCNVIPGMSFPAPRPRTTPRGPPPLNDLTLSPKSPAGDPAALGRLSAPGRLGKRRKLYRGAGLRGRAAPLGSGAGGRPRRAGCCGASSRLLRGGRGRPWAQLLLDPATGLRLRPGSWDRERAGPHTGHQDTCAQRSAGSAALGLCALRLPAAAFMERLRDVTVQGKDALPTGGLAPRLPGELPPWLQPHSAGQWPGAPPEPGFPWEQRGGVVEISPTGKSVSGDSLLWPWPLTALHEKPPECHATWTRSSFRAPGACQPGLGTR